MTTQYDFYQIQLSLFLKMESLQTNSCEVCLQTPTKDTEIVMKCSHTLCSGCLKEYISVLRMYRQLKPEKLQCLHQGCSEQIEDSVILKVFPGEEGFVLKTIRKCYRESKNPLATIFSCTGIIKSNRKSLLEKKNEMSREQHAKLTNSLVRDIKEGKTVAEDVKQCNNIHVYNRAIASKDKLLQCYLCGCTFCIQCFTISHQGLCPTLPSSPFLQLKKTAKTDNFQDFIAANQMRRCLNTKCGVAIAKQQGCFWVKCRCSWEMCYPCGKLWGDCEHFSKYPYQKFVPPADWLVKALKLY